MPTEPNKARNRNVETDETEDSRPSSNGDLSGESESRGGGAQNADVEADATRKEDSV